MLVMENTDIGLLKTHGDPAGEKMDTSEFTNLSILEQELVESITLIYSLLYD
jgi:hypothetical protein